MATSSGAHIIQVLAVVVLSGLVAVAYSQTSEDERRPYKFGFTIENMQHRQEEKDERGIIMGEYGFITADGWYLTTIYATDEEGRFKILGRKRERVGPPLDDFSPKVTILDEFSSPQVTTARPPFSSTVSPTSNPITISSPRPFQTITPTTYRPTTYRPSPSANTFVQTTASFQPSKQSQSGPFKGIPGCGSCVIPTTTSRPAVSPDFVSSTAGFRPSSGNSDRNQGGLGSNFNSDRNSNNRPGNFNSNRDTSGPGSFNNDRQTTSRPSAFDRNTPNFGNNNNFSPTNRPSSFSSNRNPSGPDSFNSDRQTNRPGSFDRNPPSGPGNFNSLDDEFEVLSGGFNRPSTRPTTGRPFSRPSSGPFASATATTPSSLIYSRPATRYPTASASPTTSRPINNNNGYNRPSLPPSGYGDNQQGESGLNYKFNYTTDFQGHSETGYRDGSKAGEYFYNGPDGVGQRVTYEANEFGYQPNVINVQLSAQETPRQDEDRTAPLRGSEFLWFKR